MPVLQFDPGSVRTLADEPNLDLTGQFRIGLDLPLRADVPTEHHAVRRLVGEDARPPALAAVGRAVVDVPADARLEHRLGDRRVEQVVFRWFEVAESFGERRESLRDRRVDHDLLPDHRGVGSGHELSSVGSSATST
jgi:hypothetical protein